ncbi:LysR family transcriptional regulator [Aureliella helgolandensis]|uniref:Hydrogen peroxide-inducible genes activator n=1 Tax=Aureliella helgolandensis TaxID=2527968 RepID=A0A518G282_9BACT|nr:LysR family transcriptional regulator [Aureliella helgolandensis]QDV22708.1 Hydrogen peroxide-inducible genes activator [Aureliella helgolandensis]
MELDQLRYFLRVAEFSNFTRAAESLMISQSALSRSIQRLEEELGQPVFERQARALKLTDAGTLLRQRAQQVLALADDMLAEITDDGQSGRIRVGAIPTIAPYLLPDVLRGFSTEFPQARLLVQEQTTDVLLKGCTDGEIDIAIVALPIVSKYLKTEALLEEELWLILPPGHPLNARKNIRVSDVESCPFVLLNEAHCLSDNIVAFCRHRAIQPVAVERTSQLATVQELVSLAHGVSFIPDMAKVRDDSSRRVYRRIAGVKPMRTIAMVWNPYRFQSKLLETFKQHLRGLTAPGK